MNRNLNGEELSEQELILIATTNGLIEPDKVAGMKADLRSKFHSKLLKLTEDVRYGMWARGELTLNTRNDRNSRG